MTRAGIGCRTALIVALAGLVGCGDAAAPSSPTLEPPAPSTLDPPVAPSDAAANPAPVPAAEPVAVALPEPTEPASSDEAPGVLSEKWYALQDDGQHAGWLHVTWTSSTYEGRPTVHDRTIRYSRQTRQMGPVEDVFESTSVTDLERTTDGLLLRQDVKVKEPGRETVVVQRWTGSGYERTVTVGDVEQRWELACDAPVPVDAEAFLAERVRAKEIDVGDEFTYPVPNFNGARMDTVRVVVKGREMLSLPTGTADCLQLEQTVVGVPGRTDLWVDEQGIVRQYAAASVRLVHTTEQRARDVPVHGVSYSITVEAEPYLPRATSFDECEVHLTVRARDGIEVPTFPDTPFSTELGRDDGVIRLRLTSHDSSEATVTLPVTDPALAAYLEPTLLECAAHPSVQAAVRSAIGDETDARTVARRLLRYVFTTLDNASGPTPSPTAAEILRDGRGDCSENAVLFVALCRAAGLPARRLSGYAQVGNLWGSHAFCEIWLGEWVGADPTTNELGTKARYIAFGWADDADSHPGIYGERLRGRSRIETVSFRDGGETLDVADLRRTDRVDPHAGVRYAEPPDGWSIRTYATPGLARLRGPGAEAQVRVHSGMGDTPADLMAEQLYGGADVLGSFAGRPAVVARRGRSGGSRVTITVPHRRRLILVNLKVDADRDVPAALKAVESMLAPTFAD